MKDGELRGIVLEKFYELRNEPPGMLDVLSLPEIISLEPNEIRLVNICEQLGEHGLIRWESTNSTTTVGGFGKITACGVDVVEGTAVAPITVTLNDHRISVSQSSHVQIGDANIQGVERLRIDKLIAAVDHSEASVTEKAEAKSLLEKLASSPLWTVLSTVFFRANSN